MPDFALFHDPNYGGRFIAESWIERARQRHTRHRAHQEFERFTDLYTAFNSWGMCVTLAKSDSQMNRILAADRQVENVFQRAVCDDKYRDRFDAVYDNFPLPSFSDLLRINPRFNWRGPRNDTYWAEIGRAVDAGLRVRKSPSLDPDRPRWSDIIGCIYMIRCNLVHGGKIANQNEARFVSVFADLLEDMLDGPVTVLMLGSR